jgi:hypothetical protein
MTETDSTRVTHTKRILFCANVLQEPFIALNLMLDVMLSIHFGASALQISILTTLRPVLAVFAFYWGSMLLFRPELLRLSLVSATAMATLPFLFAPLADNIWYFVCAEACFVLFWRAANPAQMEILKINVGKGEREQLFSKALSLSHASGIIIGPILGVLLKFYPHLWKELFCCVAILYNASALLKNRFYVPDQLRCVPQSYAMSLKQVLVQPWRDSWRLLRTNRSFAQFQCGFFIAGSGLMFAKPSIPGFLISMNLSFFEMFSLFTLLEGIGFIVVSTHWAKYLQKTGLHVTSALIVLCFALQPLLLLLSSVAPAFIFIAYFFYGAAQAGSRLVWNLSGPLLCGNESSVQYSSVNILAIGVRGCCVPVLGAVCANSFGPYPSLAISCLCMISGAFYLLYASKKQVVTIPT